MAKPNKSLDVGAKQRLSYRVVFLPLACVLAVSPHVNSIVRRARVEIKLLISLVFTYNLHSTFCSELHVSY
jgi:hypothetical protein